MLIDKLNIQRFRGISGSISLDLTAPLTVIYAPNGTGKTSICDALEWLLCGSIGRLNLLDKAEVRCQFGDDKLETFSEAVISNNQKPLHLKRILIDSNSQLYCKDKFSVYRQLTDQELLREIVTELPPSGNSSRAKVDWVRSTRFLGSESLSLLIDSDKESNDTRKLIFSNLFGVSEFQKSENSLSKILRKLPAEKSIERELIKANNKISSYSKLIDEYASDKNDVYLKHINNLFRVIANTLDSIRLLEDNSDIYELYKKLEIAYVEFNEDFNQRVLTVEFIQKNISFFEENKLRMEVVENEIKIKKLNLNEVVNVYKNLSLKYVEVTSAYEKNNKLNYDITEALDKLNEELKLFFVFFEIYLRPNIPQLESTNRLEVISEYINNSEHKITQLYIKQEQILKYLEKIPLWVTKQNSVKYLKKEIEGLSCRFSEEKDIQKSSSKILELKEKLNRLQTFREKTLSELELLLSAGKRYIEKHDNAQDCPLCKHEYKNNSELKKRIESNFLRLSERSREEAGLTSELDSLAKKLQDENNQLKNYKELTDEKLRLTQDLDMLAAEFIACGVDQEKLVDPKIILSVLKKHQDTNTQEIKNIEIQKCTLSEALKAGQKLNDMLIRVKFLFLQWADMIGVTNNTPIAIDTLGEKIKSLKSSLDHQLNVSKASNENYNFQLEKLSAEIKNIEDKKKVKEEELLNLKAHHDNISQKNNEFNRRWKLVSEHEVVDREAIKNIISDLDKKNKSASEANGLLKKAEEYFVKIDDQKKKESETEVFSNELRETKEELDGWVNLKEARSVIEQEIASIQMEVKKFVASEIQPLSNTISTLYLRAQGNRFINSISAEPTRNGLLNWIAELDDQGNSFDKMQSLSQGQRQDLALSIFLARARSLGGTFFLDEPLAHLDDLNRVALLDTLRVIVSEDNSNNLRLVLTTSSKNLLRHLREKFSLVESSSGTPALCIYKMLGNPKIGLEIEEPEIVRSPNRLVSF